MGRTVTPPVKELPISLDDAEIMTAAEALDELTEFCRFNGFLRDVRDDAFDLFRSATDTPGEPVEVPTERGTRHAIDVHDCMQTITDSAVASALAGRAFDAAPGSHFEHSLRDDACQLTNVCTNAAV